LAWVPFFSERPNPFPMTRPSDRLTDRHTDRGREAMDGKETRCVIMANCHWERDLAQRDDELQTRTHLISLSLRFRIRVNCQSHCQSHCPSRCPSLYPSHRPISLSNLWFCFKITPRRSSSPPHAPSHANLHGERET
jgi:hypothetical protein